MPDDISKVVLELQLEVKKMKGQMKEVKGYFEDLQDLISDMTKEFKDSAKEQISALKDISRTQKETVELIKRGERQKQEALKKTKAAVDDQSKALDEQKKKLGRDRFGGVRRFAGGFLGGAGLGMLTQRPTAAGMGGMLGRIPSRALGAAAGFMGTGLSAAYQQFMQYGIALGGLVGLGTRGQYRGGLAAAGGVGGAGLGYGPAMTAQQARAVGRATGNIGAVYRAQQVARATGLGVEEAGGYMGMLRQAGFGFGGMVRGPGGGMTQMQRQGTRELTKMIEAGMVSGIERARLPEFLQGASGIIQQIGGQVTGRVNVGGVAQFMATLGRTGLPGFQGARGAAVAAQLNQAIQRPGGGEAGQAMVLQALGFGKPGGQRTYYEALKLQQRGMQRPETITELFRETYRQLGVEGAGGTPGVQQEANIALSEMTGLSLDQVEQLGEVMNSSKSMDEKMAEVKEIMAESKPIEEQALEQMKKGFGGIVTHVAGVEAEMVHIGGKVAPVFMSLQKLQLQGLKILVDLLKDIVGVLKEIWFEIKLLVGKEYGAFTGDLSAAEKLLAKRAEQTGMMPEATALQRYRKYSRQAKEAKEIKEFQTKAMGTKVAYAPWNIAKGIASAISRGDIKGVLAAPTKAVEELIPEGRKRMQQTMQAAYDEAVAKRKLAKEEIGAAQAAELVARERQQEERKYEEFGRRLHRVGEAAVGESPGTRRERLRQERRAARQRGSTTPANQRAGIAGGKKRGEAPSQPNR